MNNVTTAGFKGCSVTSLPSRLGDAVGADLECSKDHADLKLETDLDAIAAATNAKFIIPLHSPNKYKCNVPDMCHIPL